MRHSVHMLRISLSLFPLAAHLFHQAHQIIHRKKEVIWRTLSTFRITCRDPIDTEHSADSHLIEILDPVTEIPCDCQQRYPGRLCPPCYAGDHLSVQALAVDSPLPSQHTVCSLKKLVESNGIQNRFDSRVKRKSQKRCRSVTHSPGGSHSRLFRRKSRADFFYLFRKMLQSPV